MNLLNFIYVGVGGFLGAVVRYSLSFLHVTYFPLVTLLINVSGSFLIGLLAGVYGLDKTSSPLILFLATGFLGGFTTFSAFSLENVKIFLDGKVLMGLSYILLSVMLGVLAAYSGYKITHL